EFRPASCSRRIFGPAGREERLCVLCDVALRQAAALRASLSCADLLAVRLLPRSEALRGFAELRLQVDHREHRVPAHHAGTGAADDARLCHHARYALSRVARETRREAARMEQSRSPETQDEDSLSAGST